MSMKYPEKLVWVANQVSHAFAHEGPERAPVSIAKHLRLFWNPSMRTRLRKYVGQGASGLDPFALKAIELLGDTGVHTAQRLAA
jgi:formate dehydrogenase subunit delta